MSYITDELEKIAGDVGNGLSLTDKLRALLRDTGNDGAHLMTKTLVGEAIVAIEDRDRLIDDLRDKLAAIHRLVGKASIDLPFSQIKQMARDNIALQSDPTFMKGADDAS